LVTSYFFRKNSGFIARPRHFFRKPFYLSQITIRFLSESIPSSRELRNIIIILRMHTYHSVALIEQVVTFSQKGIASREKPFTLRQKAIASIAKPFPLTQNVNRNFA